MTVTPPMFQGMSDRAKRIALYLLQEQMITGLRERSDSDRNRYFADLKEAIARNDMDRALQIAMACAGLAIKPGEIELAKMLDRLPLSRPKQQRKDSR